jgi:dethiobiotin synthetase
MPTWFVTGTGTDVGKTFVTQGLIRRMRARAIKPVVTGFERAEDSDSGILLKAMGRSPTEVAAVSPWRFKAPLAPDMAAARENRTVPFDDVVSFCRKIMGESGTLPLFIEGVGGIMVPLDDTRTVLDWMKILRIPALVVAGSYLGTINHTLTTLEVLRRHDLTVAAVAVSESPESPVPLAETVAAIARFADPIKIIGVPRLVDTSFSHAAFGELAAALV